MWPDLRTVDWHLPDGSASHVSNPKRNIVELPPGLDEATAVLANPMAVAMHGVRCGLGRPRRPARGDRCRRPGDGQCD